MSCTASLAVALILVVLVTGGVTARPPATGPTILRGERAPALSARVISVKPIVRGPGASRKAFVDTSGSASGPVVTGGSGLARLGGWLYLAQDDSSNLVAMDANGRMVQVRLFDAVEGRDRFHPAYGNKNRKPDVEAIVCVRASASVMRRLGGTARSQSILILFGSGSARDVRDRVAIVVPGRPLPTSVVRSVTATGLYDRLRGAPEMAGSSGQLNIEAAAAVDGGRAIRLYNRGNSGPGSVTASVDVSTGELLEYLVAARADVKSPFSAALGNPCQYDLGMSENFAISISEAIALPSRSELGGSGAILLSAIAEATTDALEDGKTSGTALGLQLAGSSQLLFTPVMQDGKPASLKIEGLAVASVHTRGRGRAKRLVMRVLGVVDADSTDPLVPSDLVELEVTFGKHQSPER